MNNKRLKFRIWDTNKNQWLKQDDWIGINNHGVVYDDGSHDYPDLSLRNSCIIQQFTGLPDKNGQEIYEGDIIRFYKKIDVYNYDYSYKMNYIQNPEKKDKWDFVETKEYTRDVEVIFSTEEVDDYGTIVSGWFVKDSFASSLSSLITEYRISPKEYMNRNMITGADYKIIGNIFETPELLKN